MNWHFIETKSADATALAHCSGSLSTSDGRGYGSGDYDGNGYGCSYGNVWGCGWGDGYGDGGDGDGCGNSEGTFVPSSCGDIWGGGESPE